MATNCFSPEEDRRRQGGPGGSQGPGKYTLFLLAISPTSLVN